MNKLTILSLLLSVFMFSACGDDDNEGGTSGGSNEKNIIGYWEPVKVLPVEVKTDSEANTKAVEEYIKALPVKSWTSWEYLDKGVAFEIDSKEKSEYRYSIKGNKLTSTLINSTTGEPEGDSYTEEFAIDGDKFIKKFDYSSELQFDFPKVKFTKAIISVEYKRVK